MRGLIIATMAALALVGATLALAATWTEDWSGDWQTRWTGVTGGLQCSQAVDGKLHMDCESGAIVSRQAFDHLQPITQSGTAYAEPRGTTPGNLAHFVIYETDDCCGARYAGTYLSYDAAAGYDRWWILAGGYTIAQGTAPHKVHDVRIEWRKPCRWCAWRYYHYLDGSLLKSHTYGRLQGPASVWLGSSAVNPGQSCPAGQTCISHAEFGPVTVTGVLK